MDARMTISNMTTEWGALVGWFPVDQVTVDYMRSRRTIVMAAGAERYTESDLKDWADTPPGPDPDAHYAAEIFLDLSQVTPHVSGPDSVQVMRSLADIERERVAIQKAYIVSCVNSRMEDLEAAARTIRDKTVADGVDLYVAAASREIEAASRESGAWDALLQAGAIPLPPGCGPCIGLGTGLLEPGEVGISATNRNFKGRMGSRDAQAYLASPEVVAASAVAGYITGPKTTSGHVPEKRFTEQEAAPSMAETVTIQPGFPANVRGRLVYVPQDNLNTDGIYGKDYTYKEGMSPEEMAAVVMGNYDPDFASRTTQGDVLVGGLNFGTGSSREQAATALQAKGIALVIAGSFSQTYLRNAYNNGFPCIECPEVVRFIGQELSDSVGSGNLTVIPGDELDVDFAASTIAYRGKQYRFPPLGSVPQSLVVAGGIENLVKAKLAD